MVEVRWTLRAIHDLEKQANFISQVSASSAELFVRNAIEKSLLLENFPRIGRIVPEIENEFIRELIYGRYRMIYRIVSEDLVHVIAVHPSAIPL